MEKKFDITWGEKTEDFSIIKVLEDCGNGEFRCKSVCNVKAEDVFRAVAYYMESKGIREVEIDGMVLKLEKKKEIGVNALFNELDYFNKKVA